MTTIRQNLRAARKLDKAQIKPEHVTLATQIKTMAAEVASGE